MTLGTVLSSLDSSSSLHLQNRDYSLTTSHILTRNDEFLKGKPVTAPEPRSTGGNCHRPRAPDTK